MNERCQNCGEYVFFNHHMWSSGRTTHGPGADSCREAERALGEMPIAYDHAIQALVRIEEAIGRFMAEASDDEWNAAPRLQRLLCDAQVIAGEGTKWPEVVA